MEPVKKKELQSNQGLSGSLEEQNKQLVRYSVEEIWNKGNYSLLDDIVSKEFVIHSNGPEKDIHGIEGVRQYFTALRRAFPDLKFRIQNLIAEGDKVVTQWIAEGTHKGNFEGIPPTGKRIKVSAIDIDQIKEGKITSCWSHVDELGLFRQLGITPTNELPDAEESKQAWDQIAEGYDRFVTDTEIAVANDALKRAGLTAGQTFLDVAAGSGGLSLPAARLGAKVLATDWSPEMIRLFRRRVRDENLSNAKGQVMDGHHLNFHDNHFDVSASQFGVMLFPDQPRALREMVRVTKPGGKVLIIAYGQPDKIDFLNFFIPALQSAAPHFQGLPSDPPPLEFQVADPDVLKERLENAGLKNVNVDVVDEKLEFNSGQQLWDWIIYGNPIVKHILSGLNLNDDQIVLVKQRLEELIRERAGKSKTAILTNQINIGIGTK